MRPHEIKRLLKDVAEAAYWHGEDSGEHGKPEPVSYARAYHAFLALATAVDGLAVVLSEDACDHAGDVLQPVGMRGDMARMTVGERREAWKRHVGVTT